MKWNNPRIELRYQKLMTDVLDRGFRMDEIQAKYQYLNNPALKTKSARLARNYELAYFLGRLVQIRIDDELETPLALDDLMDIDIPQEMLVKMRESHVIYEKVKPLKEGGGN